MKWKRINDGDYSGERRESWRFTLKASSVVFHSLLLSLLSGWREGWRSDFSPMALALISKFFLPERRQSGSVSLHPSCFSPSVFLSSLTSLFFCSSSSYLSLFFSSFLFIVFFDEVWLDILFEHLPERWHNMTNVTVGSICHSVFLFLFLSSTSSSSHTFSSEVIHCFPADGLIEFRCAAHMFPHVPTCFCFLIVFLTQKPLWNPSGLSLRSLTRHIFIQSAFLFLFPCSRKTTGDQTLFHVQLLLRCRVQLWLEE